MTLKDGISSVSLLLRFGIVGVKEVVIRGGTSI